jgi:probable F420-dependent oxidoreductase
VKVDGALVGVGLGDVAGRAAALEAGGYDGVYTIEGPHDPFFPLLLAAEHTELVELTTAIAIAFARSPMNLAHVADDLQRASAGRFVLGLGTQIKPHIEKRFSMPWSQPVARMRELVLALRAIWSAWNDRAPLDFRGEHYRHTLMTPFFDPGPNPHGPPRVFLAGVGPRMTEMAGEVADGFIVHPLASERSLRELTLPALARGAAASERTGADFEVAFPVMVATGTTDEELEAAAGAVRAQLAFYASTPAYKVVLDVHGWGELQPRLNGMSKEGRWRDMAALLTDEMVDTFSVHAPVGEVAGLIRARYGELVQRVALNAPYRSHPDVWAQVVGDLRG